MINDLAKDLILRFNIDRYLETGIYHCESMKMVYDWFKERKPFIPFHMMCVDNKLEHCNTALELFKDDLNVTIFCCSSEFLLHELKPIISPNINLMIYLDAHWDDYWPLRDELKEILLYKNKPIVIIDDYKTPDREYEFDTYHGNACGTEYIRDLLVSRAEYVYIFDIPNVANRTCGCIFIDMDEDELKNKLEGIPFVKEKI